MLIYFLHLNTQTGLSIRFSKLVSIVKGPPLELRQTRRRTRGGFTLKGAVFNPREAFKSSRGKVTHCVHQPTETAAHQQPSEETPKMAPISIQTVLISESVDPRCKKILEENGIRVTEKPNMTRDELMAEIKVKLALECCVTAFTCTGFVVRSRF